MAAVVASLLAAFAVVGWTLPAWAGAQAAGDAQTRTTLRGFPHDRDGASTQIVPQGAVAMKALGPGGRGEVKYCTGQDTTGERKASIQRVEQANPNITVQLVEFPASADEQHYQFIQRHEARSGDCDVFGPDVGWTAEFAQQKWLYDMTPYIETRKDELIPSTLETVHYPTYEGLTDDFLEI
jgi:ABC-type glycerol-3-phosphate transport system substrate-binding protein